MNLPRALLTTLLVLVWAPLAFAGGSVSKVSDIQNLPENAILVRVFQPTDPEAVFTELAKRKNIRHLDLTPSTRSKDAIRFANLLPNLDTLTIQTNIPLTSLVPILSEFKNVKSLRLTMR